MKLFLLGAFAAAVSHAQVQTDADVVLDPEACVTLPTPCGRTNMIAFTALQDCIDAIAAVPDQKCKTLTWNFVLKQTAVACPDGSSKDNEDGDEERRLATAPAVVATQQIEAIPGAKEVTLLKGSIIGVDVTKCDNAILGVSKVETTVPADTCTETEFDPTTALKAATGKLTTAANVVLPAGARMLAIEKASSTCDAANVRESALSMKAVADVTAGGDGDSGALSTVVVSSLVGFLYFLLA